MKVLDYFYEINKNDLNFIAVLKHFADEKQNHTNFYNQVQYK